MKNKFTQLCVWPGCTVGEKKVRKFENLMLDEFNARVKYASEIKTKPDFDNDGNPVPETGDRNDLLFYIHTDDIGHFAIKRLSLGIRWWEDVRDNGGNKLYSKSVLKKYPKTW